MAAVREDVQDKGHHFEDVMPLDRNSNSTNNPDQLLISVHDQAEASACSVMAAHPSTGDNASQGEPLGSAAVTAERGDVGTVVEVRANGDQLQLLGGVRSSPRANRYFLSRTKRSSPHRPPLQSLAC
jgi:hypothetical protein